METAHKRYAEVVIDSTVSELDRPFHYAVPERLSGSVEVGSLVLVPFSNRLAMAYVVGFTASTDAPNLKEISRVVDEPPLFDFDSMRLCRWIADHYLCSMSQAFRLVMPPGRSRRVKQLVELTAGASGAVDAVTDPGGPAGSALETLLGAGGSMEMSALKSSMGAGPAGVGVAALEELGVAGRRFVLTRPAASPRSRLAVKLTDLAPGEDLPPLSPRQGDVVEHLRASGGLDSRSSLIAATKASSSTLKSLEAKGLVEISVEETLRRPRLTSGGEAPGTPTPNEEQAAAVARVVGRM
ncbi:MAG: hypothetical protein FJ313_08655, partial [Gemmatimonadetes bacterium]|nr:hypothetical protein [Gemmatimonadota bacterium]